MILFIARLRSYLCQQAFLIASAYLLLLTAGDVLAGQKVSLQLRWDHQFQFAGYYAAKWQGYYDQAGLEVEIRSAATQDNKTRDAITEVTTKRADFGIGGANILTARDQGAKISVAAVIFQSSPVAIFSHKAAGINSPAHLVGKKISRRLGDITDVELQAVLRGEGINPDLLKNIAYPASEIPNKFLDGSIDAYVGYLLAGPWKAQQRGVVISIMKPATYGIDFYGDSLFTRTELTHSQPQMISRFVQASLKGWEYALLHPREIVKRIAQELPRRYDIDDPIKLNLFQAEQIRKLTHYPLIQLGNINPVRWQRMHEALHRANLVTNAIDLDSLIFDPSLQAARKLNHLLHLLQVGAAALCLILLLIFGWIWTLRRTVKSRTQALTAEISDRKKIQLEIQQLNQDLEQRVEERTKERDRFFSLSGDLLAITNTNGYFKRLNPQWTIILGWNSDDLFAVPWMHFVHPEDVPTTTAILATQQKQKSKVLEFQIRYRCRDGSYRWLEWRSVFEADCTVYTVARDITEKKKNAELIVAQQRVEAAAQAKNEFLAIMSHEIRTPLNGILGSAESLLQAPLTPDARKLALAIHRSGEILLTIIGDILDFTKIEAGKLDLDNMPFSPTVILADTHQMFQEQAVSKGLDLQICIPDDLPTGLMGDSTRVQQILMNLISNAIKFTPQGTVTITVSWSPIDPNFGNMSIQIQDSGIGIHSHDVERLFRAFEQADSSTTRQFGGTGLGLRIVKLLVEQMQGQITVSSIPEKGTNFQVTIPFFNAPTPGSPALSDALSDVTSAATSAAGSTADIPFPSTTRLLVVDDDEINRLVIHSMLKLMGVIPEEAKNGQDALQLMQTKPFDAVLMDCQMPIMDGFSATQAFRKIEQGLSFPFRIPIIALTARVMKEDREKCLDAGMDDYLSKPINMESLRSILTRWLPPPQSKHP